LSVVWISTAHWAAFTTLTNSASTLSPAELTKRPWCVTVHDLRRTSATLIASAGTSRVVLKAVLGHVDQDITAVYDRHSYAAETREAVNKLDAMIQEALKLALMDEEAREAGQAT
jgi:integrase